jgi:hypothetical protein
MSNKEREIQAIKSMTDLDQWDKKNLISKIVERKDDVLNVTTLEVEKYKIDKMIEAGLIKQPTFDQQEKRNLLNRIIDTFQNSKARYMYIATLVFIVTLFNSSNFWKYMMEKLNEQ